MSAQDPHDNPNEDTKIELASSGDRAGDAPATAAHKGPVEDVAMYDVIEPPKSAPEPMTSSPSTASQGASEPGKPRIDAPGLIDDFDEDADFSEESLLSDMRRREAAAKAALDDTVADDVGDEGWEVFRPGKNAPQFVQPKGRVTLPGVKAPAIVGGVLLVIAIVLASTRVQSGQIYAALSVVYLGLMHSITGVGAVVIGTLEAKARFGSFLIAWARMFIAVAMLLVTINVPVEGNARFLLPPVGAVVYTLVLYLLFRWKWRSVGLVALAHFGLATLLYIGAWLHGAMLDASRAG